MIHKNRSLQSPFQSYLWIISFDFQWILWVQLHYLFFNASIWSRDGNYWMVQWILWKFRDLLIIKWTLLLHFRIPTRKKFCLHWQQFHIEEDNWECNAGHEGVHELRKLPNILLNLVSWEQTSPKRSCKKHCQEKFRERIHCPMLLFSPKCGEEDAQNVLKL